MTSLEPLFVADPAYFTDGYANECEISLDVSKIGNRKYVKVPLGPTLIRGRINYAHAMPRPEPRLIDSAASERPDKKKRNETRSSTYS